MKEEKQELAKLFENTKVEKIEVNDELKKSFISYAMAVNVSRAIPDVRDGLKPVHRRIIYTMGELNLFSNSAYKKCARIVGEVMGKYHPHGDSSVYDALVRLAQDFAINCPLVEGHGNFGSVDGDSPAAMRYTEARLSKIASMMLKEIDKNTVDMYPNFDDTLMQPVVLPARFPNLLVNGSDGIAVGMATNIPPHNLGEVINAVQALIKNPDITIDELIEYIPAPDYPTKALILGRAAVKQAYRTGRGGVILRARTEIEQLENGKSKIIITEIPYQVNKARLIMQIADLVKDKRIEGISDIKEESDRHGLRIVVDVKKDANAQVVLNLLFKHTQLQVSNGIIFLALVNNEPKILNLKEMLYYYLEHQKEVITRRTQFDLGKAEERAHIVEGLVKALASIDEVIKTIKSSEDKQDALEKLINNFDLTEKQALAILDMKLQKLTGLEVKKLEEELESLHLTIEELKAILADPQKVLDIIYNDLEEIKGAYAIPRQSELSIDYGDIEIGDLIKKEDVIISKTHAGYIKRTSLSEYKAQRRGGVGVTSHKTKEEDFVEDIFMTNSHDDLMFFTNKGKVYTLKAYYIPEASKQAKGRALVNLIQIEQNEKVTTIIPIKENTLGNLVMATKNGLIKKTNLSEFENIRKTGKIAISLNEDDELIWASVSTGKDEILLGTHNGKCIRFSEADVRNMGRTAQGVRSIKLGKDDYVVEASIIKENYKVMTITENGYGKRVNVDEYRKQNRGGSGVSAGTFNEKTGKLVCLKQVADDQDIMLTTDSGIMIRTPIDTVSVIGRTSQGVRLMKLRNDAKIVSAVMVEKDEEDITEVDLENTTEQASNAEQTE